jgi:hypothetical protein
VEWLAVCLCRIIFEYGYGYMTLIEHDGYELLNHRSDLIEFIFSIASQEKSYSMDNPVSLSTASRSINLTLLPAPWD